MKLPNIAYHHLVDRYSQPNPFLKQSDFMGRLTGEFRPPKKGEWYLSGAIPECYLAQADLSTAFYIIKVVRIKRIETIIEVEQ